MKSIALKQLDVIAQTIFDKKGFNILVLDVRGVSTMTDYFVIAEGTVDRHVKALSRAVITMMEEAGQKPIFVEGEQLGDWIVVDYGDIVIHLFTPELRERYALESLWKNGKIVDAEINVEKPQVKA